MTPPFALGADPADRRPLLRFAGRGWSRAELLAAADGLAAELRRRGLAPGQALGVALPNLPAAVIALLAGLCGGYRALPVDPRQPVDSLLDWQARLAPAALVTLDLATVFERTRPLLEEARLRHVVVARMADDLAPLPRLLSPWLRAGGTVRRLPDARGFFWIRKPGAPGPGGGTLTPPDGTALTAEALLAGPALEGQHLLALPLADPRALAALFAAWRGAATLVLSPRLDAKGLAKAAKLAGASQRIG